MYILAIQQVITHKEHLRYSFDLWQYSELSQKPYRLVKQQKVAKTASNLILLGQFLGKVAIFRCFDVCSVRPPQTF